MKILNVIRSFFRSRGCWLTSGKNLGVSTDTLSERLSCAFEKNGWNLNAADGSYNYYKKLYSKFYIFLYSLTPEEQDLIFPLISIYHYCPAGDYDPLVWRLAEEISALGLDDYDALYILTLTKPEDAGKSKSASFLVSHLRDQAIQEEYDLARKPLYLYENQELLNDKHADRENSLVVFVDDFIGSGETAADTLQYYMDNVKKESDRVVVFSFVTMSAAIGSIVGLGVEFYTFLQLPKGISESGLFQDINSAKDLMLQLEERLTIPALLQLGYEQSEATVTMMRTPDNTFPVFWHSDQANGGESLAPMRRIE